MPLVLVVGTDSTGRRSRTLDIIQAASGDRALVARTQTLAHDIGRFLSKLGHPGWIPVYSWRRWLEGVWLGVGDGRTPADNSVRDLVISELLADREAAGPSRAADLLDKVGGRRLLASLVAAYPSEAIERGDPSLGHHTLLAAARDYGARLGIQRYVEFEDIVCGLSGIPSVFQGALGVVGFLTLAPHECRLLLSLSEAGALVVVELPYVDGEESTRVNGAVVADLVRGGATIVEVDPRTQQAGSRLTALVGGAQGDGGGLRESVDSGQVTFWVGEGYPAETCLVVDAVEAELAHHGNPDKVGVIVRQINTNIHRLVAEFERRNIPYAVSTEVPVATTGLGAALIQICDIAEGLRFSSSTPGAPALGPFLASAYSGMNGGQASSFDAKLRRLRRGLLSAVRDIAYSKQTARGFGSSSALGRVLSMQERAEDDVALARGWKLVSDELLANSRSALQASWLGETQDLRAHASFAEILAALTEAGLPLTPANLRTQIYQATVTVSPPPNASGLVLITAPGGVVGRQIEALVVMGLTAGEVGGGSSSVSSERRVASQVGIDAPIDATGERMLRDVAVLAAATDRIHFVWRALDGLGKPIEPAPVLEELLLGLDLRPSVLHQAFRRVAGAGVDLAQISADEDRLLMEQLVAVDGLPPTEARTALSVVLRGHFHGLGSSAVAAVRSAAHTDRAIEYQDPHSHAPTYGPRGQRAIRFPDGYWDDRATSPSAIETYAQCPYKWFLGRLVRLEELDDDYSAAVAGEVVHELLERFYVTWTRVERRGPLSEDSLPAARELFDSLKAKVVQQVLEARSSSWGSLEYGDLAVGLDAELAWGIIADDARGELYEGGAAPFEPRYFEWQFGPDAHHHDAAPEEERELDIHEGAIEVGGIPLRGSIDRIDMAADPDTGEMRMAVLDYKSGSEISTKSLPEVIRRRRLQVPIYLIAAARGLGFTPALGAYVGYKKRNMAALASTTVVPSKNCVSDEEFRSTLVDVEEHVRRVGHLMRGGNIAPVSAPDEVEWADCKYCANWWCTSRPKGDQW